MIGTRSWNEEEDDGEGADVLEVAETEVGWGREELAVVLMVVVLVEPGIL